MKDTGHDRSRLGDPARAARARDSRAERAHRLLAAARGAPPPPTVSFSDIEAAIRARRWAGLSPAVRWIVGGAVALCPVLALGSIAVSHGWIATTAAPSRLAAPASAPARSARAARGVAAARRPDAAVPGAALPNGGTAPATSVEPPARAPVLAAPAPEPHGGPAPTARARPKAAAAAGVVAVASSVEGPSAAGAVSAPSPGVPVAPNARGGPAPATDEIGLVRDALERLRGQKDAAGALQRLDERDQRFPSGLLGEESSTIRIEALLALGRKSEALARLDALPGSTLDRSPRLRVARGELRVAAGRCPEALADFSAVVAGGAGGEITQRADRGRAACNFGTPRHTGATGGDR
jgi:hypothetical protein